MSLQLGLQDYNTALNAYNNEYNKNVKAVDLYNDKLIKAIQLIVLAKEYKNNAN